MANDGMTNASAVRFVIRHSSFAGTPHFTADEALLDIQSRTWVYALEARKAEKRSPGIAPATDGFGIAAESRLRAMRGAAASRTTRATFPGTPSPRCGRNAGHPSTVKLAFARGGWIEISRGAADLRPVRSRF